MSSFAVSLRRCRLGRRPLVLLLAATLLAALLPVLSERRPSGAAVDPLASHGLWLVAQDGGIFSFGDADFFGSTGSIRLNQPVVGMAGTPSMDGYWMVASDGGIFSFGEADFHGSTGDIALNKPVVGMAATPSGDGYWLVASDGGVFSFGDAGFYGSTGDIALNQPIVGMAATPSGNGYWMVASDGGIFAFGDAEFYGSTGDIALNQPIVGMAPTASNQGYWLVASDGGLFSFGDAGFYGSSAGTGKTIVGMIPTPSGQGYYQATDAGELIGFGDAHLSAPPMSLNQKMIGLAAAHQPAAAGGPGTTTVTGTNPTAPGQTTTSTGPGAGLFTPAQKVAQAGQPNVMVIVVDDMRYESIMDRPEVLPLTKQWLADGGASFTEGTVTTPLCCPMRSMTWSGRLPHNHGVFGNTRYDPELPGFQGTGDGLDRDWVIPRYLKDAGYRTALAGKWITNWHFATAEEGRYDIPHFDEYAVLQGGYVDARIRLKDVGDTTYDHVRTSDPEHSDNDYSTDFLGQKVNEWVDAYEADDAQPWYMHIAPHTPHDDTTGDLYKPAPRHVDTPIPSYEPTPAAAIEGLQNGAANDEMDDKVSDIRSKQITLAEVETHHDGMLRTLLAFDEMVDSVMRNLEARGELDNTLVIFTSDNGYHWGERGADSKGWPYREGIHTAWLVRWPGVFPAGGVDTRLIGPEDILPTLLEAAQYTPPQLGYELDGQSFLPGNPAREVKYLEFGPKPGPAPEGYAGNHRGIPTWAALKTADWHYIEYYEEGDNQTLKWREYYDLTSDPWELDNIHPDPDPSDDSPATPLPDRFAQLSSQLQTLRGCVGSTGSNACP